MGYAQLLAHLVGDYVLQDHWMALRKKTSWVAAIIHALTYGLSFVLFWLVGWIPEMTVWQWTIIVVTHLLIDHYGLAQYWVDFYGIGKAGWLPTQIEFILRGTMKIAPPNSTADFTDHPSIQNSMLPPDAPPFLGVWLLILVDNTMHLVINYAVLAH